MALAIVPRDAAFAAACSPSDLHVGPLPHLGLEPDDLHALATELTDDEGLGPIEGTSQALALQDDLLTFAALWDAHAATAGNPYIHDPFILDLP